MMRRIFAYIVLLLAYICSYAQGGGITKMSATIEFVVNTDIIIENDNYRRYVNEILPEVFSRADEVEAVLIVGSASPEGNVNGNIKLANMRSSKIYSGLANIIPAHKVIRDNNYGLFLSKTGLDESDYARLRATYVEITFSAPEARCAEGANCEPKVIRDTVFLNKETVTLRETVIERNTESACSGSAPSLSIYNDIAGDLIKRGNVGIELYFSGYSFFLDGYFSPGEMLGKTYVNDIWHTGFRKYFNNQYDKVYIEVYGRCGYFDTDIFNENGFFGIFYGGGIGLGYKFSLCSHWKIYPSIRFGIDKIHYRDYYSQSGNVNVSFGNYVDGQGVDITGDGGSVSGESVDIVYNEKTINKEFIDNSVSGLWFGPTFIGITLQRDFHFRKKNN